MKNLYAFVQLSLRGKIVDASYRMELPTFTPSCVGPGTQLLSPFMMDYLRNTSCCQSRDSQITINKSEFLALSVRQLNMIQLWMGWVTREPTHRQLGSVFWKRSIVLVNKNRG